MNSDGNKNNNNNNKNMNNNEIKDDKNDFDEDEKYCVVVSKDGKIVVKENENFEKSLQNEKTKSNLTNQKPSNNKDDNDDIKNNNNNNSNVWTSKTAGNEKKRKLKEPGIEYKSKKSGGDVWKKGMLEPHAYIPLDPRLLSKKNYKEAVQHFGVVVKNGKKNNKLKNKK
jgi:ribosomal RNA-processing protein 12